MKTGRWSTADEEATTSALPQSTLNVLSQIGAVELVDALQNTLKELPGRRIFQGLGDGNYLNPPLSK